MHYKPAVDKKKKMARHTSVQNDDTKRLAQDCRYLVEDSEPYSAHCDEFMDMLLKIQSVWNCHLDPISVAKHRRDLLKNDTQPIH